jgi:beta-glucosidase
MNREEARKRATELVDKMTVEEMASQLRFDAPAIERLDIPAYNWWSEALHGVARAGVATVFPQAIGLAAMFDDEMLEQIGDAVSDEARAKYNAQSSEGDRDIYKGLTLWSPNVNIFRDPRWGRGHETYGEDPYLTTRLGVAYVKGLQGHGEYLKAAACAKHFAVHSGPEALRHSFNAKVNNKDLYETYLPAFEGCVKEGKVEAVMGAYNRTNDEPCCANTVLMEEILRGDWRFEGHFVSDCWAVLDFHEHHMVTKNSRESAALAISKGCDVNCGSTYLCLMQAYKEKKVTKDQIRTAAIRLFTTRFLLGLFDKTELDNIGYDVVSSKEHLALSEKAAERSMVLLKNDGLLPLKKEELKSIAVIGPNANSRAALVGNYHGTAARYHTISDGIFEYLEDTDVRVYASEGCHLFKEKTENLAKENDRIAEAVTCVKNADVTVLVLGLDETLEGEEGDTGNSYASGDKNDLELPKSQQVLIDAVLALGKPVIAVNMTGSAMNLRKLIDNENVKAIIQAWYPGSEGGRAFAKILFGQVSPSGKLPVTFYENVDELPDFTDYNMKGRTYRYMEGKAQFGFGFGLTYGECKVKNFTENREERTVTVTAANEGSFDTEDVIQIYAKNTSEYAPKNVSLVGFKRVFLKAGEKKIFTVKLSDHAYEVCNNDGKWINAADSCTLYAGFSQPK